MARIPLVDPDDPAADPQAAAILHRIREAVGADLNVYRGVANHPKVFTALTQFGPPVYLANSLTPAERELAYLTASVVNRCHY